MVKNIFSRALLPALCACLFVFVLGARWTVFDRFGMALPEWDQWDAEGLMLLVPWFSHDHFPQALFSAHNEHRVVLTKLLNLGLILANGQWDQRLEAVVNAILPAALAVALLILAHRHLAARWLAPLWILFAAVFGLPFAWENMIYGFHSQQFFLIGLAVVTLALLPFAKPFSARWWLGASAAALGLLSMASGFFAAAIVIGLLGARWLRRDLRLREIIPTLVVCTIVVAVGWFTRHEVEYHATLKAKGISDFFLTIIRSLQWPAPLTEWFALVIWFPWMWVSVRVLFSRKQLSPHSRRFGLLMVGLGGWVWLQLIATGYARGAGGPAPASRYIDTLLLGLIANAFALAWLATPGLLARRARFSLAALAAAWIGLFSWGASHALHEVMVVELPPVKIYHDFCEQNVSNYLLTGDVSHLSHEEIPYPGTDSFLERIGIADLYTRLPGSVRQPLPLAAAQSTFSLASGAPSTPAPGVAPSTLPLLYRTTWGSFSESASSDSREFVSAPLRASLGGWLKIETAGHPTASSVTFELRDAYTHALISSIIPRKLPGNGWRPAYVRAPAGEFVIYASSTNAAEWFAFSQPVEIATGSYWTWQLAKNGWLFAAIALGTAAAFALVQLIVVVSKNSVSRPA